MGAVVILFDPIFQGLAIALMFGSLASTVLTLIVVPVLYYMVERHKYKTPLPPSWDDGAAGNDAEAESAA
jgi:preprotein translocase subunit SecF